MEEIAFSDWTDKMNVCGSNHWLPAYGYQQPTHLQQDSDLLVNDAGALLIAGQQAQQFIFLETIVEETSDDLRSESDRSGPAGWLDSDSDTESVIHVARSLASCDTRDWSGSERDLAVPKKRRRRTTDDERSASDVEEDELIESVSRSSSLLQFECLEKHYEDVFLTSASSDPFADHNHSPSVASSFSFDSLESHRWRFSGSPDSLDDLPEEPGYLSSSGDEGASSDDTLQHSSWSSRGSFCSARLRSFRSFDSLNLLQQPHNQLSLAELSASLGNSSGFQLRDGKLDMTSADLRMTADEPRVLMSSVVTSQDVLEEEGVQEAAVVPVEQKPQRSAENLSEDSGFGDHIPPETTQSDAPCSEEEADCCSDCSSDSSGEATQQRTNTSTTSKGSGQVLKLDSGSEFGAKRGWEVEEAKYNSSCWQSAPDLSLVRAATPNCEDSTRSLLCLLATSSDDEGDHCVTTYQSPTQHGAMQGSTHRGALHSPTQQTTPAAGKGVHFSPIVSELSWREVSYSEDDSRDDETEDVEEVVEQPVVLLQKIQVGLPVGASGLRERVVVELKRPEGESHVVRETRAGDQQQSTPVSGGLMERRGSVESSSSSSAKKTGIGGFLQRFSLRRLSGRFVNTSHGGKKHKEEKLKQKQEAKKPAAVKQNAEYEDVRIIPLHPPPDEVIPAAAAVPDVVVSSKPPLPPLPPRVVNVKSSLASPSRRRRDVGGSLEAGVGSSMSGVAASGRGIDRQHVVGLLETDLDKGITSARHCDKKARSLLSLTPNATMMLQPPPVNSHHGASADARAKSMEFLLDKENQAAIQPPENELQKGGAGERVMSEHQLRVQRSLQKLNVPDWYKNSAVPREGFLLKRDGSNHKENHQGWPGLGSKTTSLSSLGSSQSAAARSPTSHLLSPSPTPHVFTRWSTSRLNSNNTSASTSPCGSTRSSFNYRQPYLGWRSQERLSRPRTPAERLAAGILPVQGPISPPGLLQQQEQQLLLQQQLEQAREQQTQVPNLSEVRTSIKEVTSAIVHYVSGVRDGSGEALAVPTHYEGSSLNPSPRWELDSLSPRGASPRSVSPRGGSRLCWLESSFVGTRPLDSPETPLTLSSDVKVLESSLDSNAKLNSGGDLYLQLNNTHHHMNGEYWVT